MSAIPVELGGAYSDAGADELVFLDISATLEARGTLVELVGRVAERLAIRSPSAAAFAPSQTPRRAARGCGQGCP